MSFDNLLIHTCTISRPSSISKDDYGHTKSTWTTVTTGVRCRIDYNKFILNQLNHNTFGRNIRAEYIGYFKADANLQAGDRIISIASIDGSSLFDSIILYVRPVQPLQALSSLHHKEILLGLEE